MTLKTLAVLLKGLATYIPGYRRLLNGRGCFGSGGNPEKKGQEKPS